MVKRWLVVNDKAEREGNWRQLADYFAEDIKYGWETPNGKYHVKGVNSFRLIKVPNQGWKIY